MRPLGWNSVGLKQKLYPIPKDATEVDYISTNGNNSSYIETDIIPNFKSIYEIDTEFLDNDYNNKTVFAALETNPSWVWFFVIQTFNNYIDQNYGENGQDDRGTVKLINNHKYTAYAVVQNGIQYCECMDQTVGETEKRQYSSTNFQQDEYTQFNTKLRLFNRTNILANPIDKLGKTIIRVDGIIVHYFVPVIDHELNYRMFDRKTGKYFSTGTFSGGFWPQ